MNLALHPLMRGYKYYYTTLTETQKRVYTDLYAALCRHESTVTTATTDDLAEIIEMVVADNPLLFFFREYNYTVHLNKTVVNFEYLLSESKVAELVALLYKKVKDITKGVENASDFEKEKHFHDFFAENICYNNAFPKYSFMAIGALLYGSAVCAGISSAFKLLCDFSKLPCIVVHGEVKNGGAHAWNKIYIQNDFYNVDITYDTTLSDSDVIRYDYFNVPDAWLADRKETGPSIWCNAQSYNYHVANGLYFAKPEDLKRYVAGRLADGKKLLNLRVEPSLFDGSTQNEIEKIIMGATPKLRSSYIYSFNKEQGIFILYERG